MARHHPPLAPPRLLPVPPKAVRTECELSLLPRLPRGFRHRPTAEGCRTQPGADGCLAVALAVRVVPNPKARPPGQDPLPRGRGTAESRVGSHPDQN